MATNLTRYAYDYANGAFLNVVLARQDPEDPDNVLEPAGSTDKEPPVAGQNQVAIFNPSVKAWSLSPDFRGQIWFDNLQAVIVEIPGDPTKFTPPLSKEPNTPAQLDPTKLNVDGTLSLDDQKLYTRSRILQYLDSVGGTFTANYSKTEIQSWTLKETAARAYMAKETLSDSQNAILNTEFSAGNYTSMDDLVLSIIQNADLFAAISGFMSGARTQAFADITKATSTADLDTVFNSIKSAIETKLGELAGKTA